MSKWNTSRLNLVDKRPKEEKGGKEEILKCGSKWHFFHFKNNITT